nr:hypothetical protein FNV92_06175 [Bradyrhizobium cosmicum]
MSGYFMLQSVKESHRLLRAWQLALLRFAVTLDESDRLNAAALAAELDRPSGQRDPDGSLHFFRRTSSQLCAAISGQLQDADAILDCFCKQIGEPRLTLAFAAAIGMTHPDPGPAQPMRRPDLFSGLPARRSASL